ncbi:MAG: SLBB domain-containing protein [Acidobacteria bacterium]|nr:SLBB domain-containing protein [Acidobacteriota bacterium]
MSTSRFLVVLVAGVLAGAAPVRAQTAQQQALRNNPELIRRQIQQSGLTPDQIRERLRQAGYSPSALDQFLPSDQQRLGVDADVLSALSVLGIDTMLIEGLDTLPVIFDSRLFRDSVAAADEELSLFGLNVFRTPTSQFQPILSGPVPSNYRLGPGDVMVIVLTGDVEFVYERQVTREGFIVIPQVGQVFVNNLTMEQLQQLLRQRLARSYSGIRTGTTQFDVSIARLRANQIFVIGEIVRPGSYQLSSVATVLNALYAAGGPTERGNFREIEIRRGGETIATFDLYDYLLQADVSNDVMLEQGDIVFVPVQRKRVSVSGAVVRPAIYELKPAETLSDLIQAAGGFRADAAFNRLAISRIVPVASRSANGPDRVVIDVPLNQITDGKAPPFPIEPGDSVMVFEVVESSRAMVELKGNVYHPGTFGWHAGMRLSDLIRLAGGFRPATYAGRVHIERLNAADSTRYLVNVELPADSSEPFSDDIALQEYDVVTVYGRDEFRTNRTVSIGGMVNEPGPYPYRAGMTLRDLVLMARGFRDGAHLDTVEVSRLPADRSGGQLAVRLRVPIDSTYLFERSTTYPLLPGPPTVDNGAPEVELEPFDWVTILRQPGFELLRTVDITGEVRFPGPYALTHKEERVSSLIARAGGLLLTAYVDGARFFRDLDTAEQIDRRLSVALQDPEGRDTIVTELELAGVRVNMNLSAALRSPESRDDIVLHPGDSLHVPEYIPTVLVEGAVNSRVNVLYVEGANLDYYIGNAGGFTRFADEGRVSVRYANGSARVKKGGFLFFGSTPKPGPGSTVFVPTKDPSAEGFDITSFVRDLVGIAASIATVILVIDRTR